MQDVRNCNDSAAILVQEPKSLANYLLFTLAQTLAHAPDELLVGNVAIAVDVVVLH